MRLKNFLICLALNFTSIFILFSQDNGQLIYETITNDLPFTITQFATKHGLPQNQILKIKQLSNGNLLLSTANGIIEFNGNRFINIIPDKNHKNYIFSDLIVVKNKIYGQLFGGGFYEVKPKLKHLTDIFTSDYFNGVFYGVSRNGDLYVSSDNSKNYKLFQKKIIKDPQQILIDYPYLYVAGENGVVKLNLKTKISEKIYSEYIQRLKIINSKIYFLSHREMFEYNLQTKKTSLIFETDFPEISFFDFEKIKDNEFYIATNKGLIHLLNGKSFFYNKNSGMPSEYFHCLFFSKKDNCLFIGSGQKGLLKLDFKQSKSIFKPEDLILNSLNSIVLFENKILVGGAQGSIFEIQNNKAEVYSHLFSNLASLSVINDTLIVGTWGDGFILIKNSKKIGHISSNQAFVNNHIHSAFKDSKKRIWIGTSSGISIGNSLESIKPFKEFNAKVICFYELKNGSICIGTSKGFYIVNKNLKKIKFIGVKQGFQGKEVRSFYEDNEGKIWVGTYTGGLYCFHKNKLTSINLKKNCKLPNDFFCFAKDKNNMFYFTGNLGLYGISEKKLNEFYYNKIEFLIPYYFGEQTGIYNTEFNGGFQNNYLVKNDNFYFPTIEGICVFQPKKHYNKISNSIEINSVYVNDNQIDLRKTIFKNNTYSIQINFSTNNFNSTVKNYFQYKLIKNGTKSNWSKLSNDENLKFNQLTPGKYLLKLRIINSFNQNNPKIRIFNFEIQQKFSQTWYFYLLIALSLILFSGFFVKWRANIHKNQIIFNGKVNNQLLELKLSAIQSKMNPHFIFNVLNNIKYLLMFNKNDQAEVLVDDFSSLLRKFIVYNDKFFTTVIEEIEFIKLYVNIERTRLNNSFDFNLFIDEELENRIIPTMLIQPFIENAIKHGICSDTKPSFISLSINKVGDFIVIRIEDNGIGIEKSKKLKPKNSHESKGIMLVKAKIDNLKLKYNIFVNLIFKELNLLNENGTIVELKILIENEDELRNN